MSLLLCLLIGCLDCHKELAGRYARTPMANSSGAVEAAREPEGGFHHPLSRTRYDIKREDGALRLNWNGGSVALAFFIGSRRMGRSYAYLDKDHLYQAPVGYYANKRAWDMAPGYAADRHPDFDRPITPECLFCHSTAARSEPGTLNRITAADALQGIGCQRCHGGGALHSANPRRDNIINPARLARPLRSAVCEQCHLAGEARIELPGRSLDRFAPGEALSDYVDVFVSTSSAGVRVNGHADALARSRCAQESQLWCGSCHNPHGPSANFRQTCLGCHGANDCSSPQRDNGDCVRCHMPKARAYDGGHTVFTDHSIPRKPASSRVGRSPATELVPYFGRRLPEAVAQRNLGLAYASAGSFEKAWPLLREAAQAKPKDARLYAQIAILLEADGRLPQAAGFYRMALEIDPDQDASLTRLGLLLARQGQTAEARPLLAKALVRNPRQPEVRKRLEALD
jgi:hypothetical protein